jgi:hypothetical protein
MAVDATIDVPDPHDDASHGAERIHAPVRCLVSRAYAGGWVAQSLLDESDFGT